MANWEIVVEGRQGANDMLTVLHYQSSGVEPPDFSAAATVFAGHITDHLVPICGPRVTWLGLTVREDIVGGVGVFVPFGGGMLTGVNADGDHADVVTMLVRKQSGGLIRPTHGWFQQGGISMNATQADGSWVASVMDEVEAYAEDIRVLNIAGPSTLTMVIKARNPTAPNTQAYSVVNSFTAHNRPRTQRSRIELVGS